MTPSVLSITCGTPPVERQLPTERVSATLTTNRGLVVSGVPVAVGVPHVAARRRRRGTWGPNHRGHDVGPLVGGVSDCRGHRPAWIREQPGGTVTSSRRVVGLRVLRHRGRRVAGGGDGAAIAGLDRPSRNLLDLPVATGVVVALVVVALVVVALVVVALVAGRPCRWSPLSLVALVAGRPCRWSPLSRSPLSRSPLSGRPCPGRPRPGRPRPGRPRPGRRRCCRWFRWFRWSRPW